MANQVESKATAKIFKDLAAEEMKHRAILENLEGSGGLKPANFVVADLKVSDYLVEVEPSANMDYQDALILAMKREKAAYRLYIDLAEGAQDQVLKETFENLAQKEAGHKLRLETIYDEQVLTDN
jgi:rubrerythrin